MSEIANSKDDFILELKNGINLPPIDELKDIHNPDLLVNYLQDLNKIYEENEEDQYFLEKADSRLNEDVSLAEKKIKTIEKEITKKKESLNKNKITLNSKQNKRRISFFESLQYDDEKEIILKKNNILSEEIKNLESSKKKSDNSYHNFRNLTKVNFSERNSEIIILITNILEILKTKNLENISKERFIIIEKSIEISDFLFPEFKMNQRKKYHNNLLIYLGLSIPLLFISCYFRRF